jgi:hypothetical protein
MAVSFNVKANRRPSRAGGFSSAASCSSAC